MTAIQHSTQSLKAFYSVHYEKLFTTVARWVSKKGGNLEEAKDLFHDALIVLHERSAQNNFRLEVNEEAYIIGVVSKLWSNRLQKQKHVIDIAETTERSSSEEETVNLLRLYEITKAAGQKCLDILSQFYFQKMPVKKIAEKLGFSSEHSASVQKYKCIERVKGKIKQHALSYEDFLE